MVSRYTRFGPRASTWSHWRNVMPGATGHVTSLVITGGVRSARGTYGASLPRTPSDVCGSRCASRLSASGREVPGSATAAGAAAAATTPTRTRPATDARRRDMGSRLGGVHKTQLGGARGATQRIRRRNSGDEREVGDGVLEQHGARRTAAHADERL